MRKVLKLERPEELKFVLDNERYLRLFASGENIKCLISAHHVEIYWHFGGKRFLAGTIHAADLRDGFDEVLEKAISNDLLFEGSLCISPGVMTNMFYYSTGKYNKKRKHMKEDGIKYNIFSAYREKGKYWVGSFLYNDNDGNIIFEIVPMFNWLDEELVSDLEKQKEEGRFVSFIDNYKPIIREVIPRDVAKKWLIQVKRFNEVILYNQVNGCGCFETT